MNTYILFYFNKAFPKIQKSEDFKKEIQHAFKKISTEAKFCNKVMMIAKDVEGQETAPTLADCWRWIKGLLCDFIALKNQLAQGKKAYEEKVRYYQEVISQYKRKLAGQSDQYFMTSYDNSVSAPARFDSQDDQPLDHQYLNLGETQGSSVHHFLPLSCESPASATVRTEGINVIQRSIVCAASGREALSHSRNLGYDNLTFYNQYSQSNTLSRGSKNLQVTSAEF